MLRIIILLCFSLFSSLLYSRTVSFTGKVESPKSEFVDFGLIKDGLTLEKLIYKSTLKPEENTFAIAFDIGQHNWVTIRHADEEFNIFVADTDQKIEFSFIGGSLVRSVYFSGDGANNNNFLKNFIAGNEYVRTGVVEYEAGGLITYIDAEVARMANSYSVYDYFDNLESKYNVKRERLFTTSNLDRKLFMHLNKVQQWKHESNKIAYFLLNKDLLSVEQLRNYWAQFSVLQSIDSNDDASVQYPDYQNLLSSFIHYLDLESPGNAKKQDFAYYQFVKGNLMGRSRYLMQAKLMLGLYQRNSNPRLAERMFKGYKRDNPYPEYTQSLEDVFGGEMRYVPKTEVPNFTAVDPMGNEVNLTDFRGKVVYISFWASWCAPCLKGFRETHLMRQQLKEQGVVFLNINMDTDMDKWKNGVARINVPGKHLFPTDMVKFQAVMEVGALPHYVVVNKFGKLTYLTVEDLNYSKEDFASLLNE